MCFEEADIETHLHLQVSHLMKWRIELLRNQGLHRSNDRRDDLSSKMHPGGS